MILEELGEQRPRALAHSSSAQDNSRWAHAVKLNSGLLLHWQQHLKCTQTQAQMEVRVPGHAACGQDCWRWEEAALFLMHLPQGSLRVRCQRQGSCRGGRLFLETLPWPLAKDQKKKKIQDHLCTFPPMLDS